MADDKKFVTVSYTAYSAMKRGEWDAASAMLLGQYDWPASPQMELGIIWHKAFEEETKKTTRTPVNLGVDFKVSAQEKFYSLEINDWIKLNMKIDAECKKDKLLIDYKVGSTELSTYMSSIQLDFYGLACPWAKFGAFVVFNPYKKTTVVGVRHITKASKEWARNEIITLASEFRDQRERLGLPWWREKKEKVSLF